MQNKIIPWSDNWWIENDKAWFCAGEFNALFCVDLNTQQCELLARIPECSIKDFRLYPFCIKYKDIIFCLPDIGKNIWYYDIKHKTWGKIQLNNKNRINVNIDCYKQDNKNLILIEEKSGMIFKINLEKRVVEEEYSVFLFDHTSDNVFGSVYALMNDKIYYPINTKIFELDINKKEAVLYQDGSSIGAKQYCICYDNDHFWLNGYSKEIYICNKAGRMVNTIIEYPSKLEDNYCQSEELLFLTRLIPLGNYIWCIPFQLNEIMYIHKDSFEISVLEIPEERQTVESVKDNLVGHKYLVEYIREDRYIGIYSLKNQWIFEIDTYELCVKRKEYTLSNTSMQNLVKVCSAEKVALSEKNNLERILFSMILDSRYENRSNKQWDIGEVVFQNLCS